MLFTNGKFQQITGDNDNIMEGKIVDVKKYIITLKHFKSQERDCFIREFKSCAKYQLGQLENILCYLCFAKSVVTYWSFTQNAAGNFLRKNILSLNSLNNRGKTQLTESKKCAKHRMALFLVKHKGVYCFFRQTLSQVALGLIPPHCEDHLAGKLSTMHSSMTSSETCHTNGSRTETNVSIEHVLSILSRDMFQPEAGSIHPVTLIKDVDALGDGCSCFIGKVLHLNFHQ